MVGNGETLNYNQKVHEIYSLSFFYCQLHGGQKEAVFKYFLEMQMQTMKYNCLHVKSANFGKL